MDWDLGKVSSYLVALTCVHATFVPFSCYTNIEPEFCLFSQFIIGCPSLEASQFHLCTHKCTTEREATQSPNESSQSRALHHALRLGHEDDLSAAFTHELGGMAACRIERKSEIAIKKPRFCFPFLPFLLIRIKTYSILAHYTSKECVTDL